MRVMTAIFIITFIIFYYKYRKMSFLRRNRNCIIKSLILTPFVIIAAS